MILKLFIRVGAAVLKKKEEPEKHLFKKYRWRLKLKLLNQKKKKRKNLVNMEADRIGGHFQMCF